ncbi:N-acetylmuramoyl-L-alanine amidase [Sagittula sp.]|uniref:N-acetylmuramoyl-L-alanine amidase n=1 Tax=Sagittula sp. TaxID=2038081 RepID=UPI00351828B5
MRVALIIGHDPADEGAARCTDGVQEYSWNRDLANRIHDLDPEMFEIFHIRPDLGYSASIREVYGRVDDWGCDLSLELHFNSFGSPTATGTGTFSSGSAGSLHFARAIHPAMVQALGLRDRGIKIRNASKKGRGYKSLIFGRAPALLLEPYFGSNPNDCRRADECKQALAEAIYQAVRSAA